MTDFFIKKDPRNGRAGPNSQFWEKFGRECARLSRLYPNLKAQQIVRADGSEGEWVISGPPAGVHTYKELACLAARHLGFHGTDALAVQFWLDHMNGKHIIRRTPQQRRDDIREAQVTMAKGVLERYRGRQKLG